MTQSILHYTVEKKQCKNVKSVATFHIFETALVSICCAVLYIFIRTRLRAISEREAVTAPFPDVACVVTRRSFVWILLKTFVMKGDVVLVLKYSVMLKRSI